MLGQLTHDDFAPLRHQRFQIQVGDDVTLDVELIRVEPLGGEDPQRYRRDPTRRRPFSLLFRGPRTPVLSQRIYPVEHPQLGTLDIFLVPVGPIEDGMGYEAIFT
jgi:hypothetical protein